MRTPRILVVDDDVATCQNLQDILTDLGYVVAVAHDGEKALELVRTNVFDVALLDLKMPGMDGLTLQREIRKVSAGTVGIIVTAYSGPTTALDAEEAGVWQVLPKPVDPPQLLRLVDEALDQPLILIVDDDEALCGSLWDLFRERGYRVCVAHSLQAAAEQLPHRDFQVALIDLRLPDGSGTKVHDLVRKACPSARTVLITAFVSELDREVQKLLNEGADAACYKPFDMPKLLDTIVNLVQTDRPLEPAQEEV